MGRGGIFDDDDWRMGRLDEGEAKEVEQALVSGRYGSVRRAGGAWPAARPRPQGSGPGRSALQVRHMHVSLNTGGRRGRSRTGLVVPPGGAAAHQSYVLRLEEDESVRGEEILTDELGPVEGGNIGFDHDEVVAFWDAAEAQERRGGRVQNRLVLEIPHELEPAAVRELVTGFGRDVLEARGLPYHAVVHRPQVSAGADPRNVHAHVLYSDRGAERLARGAWEFAPRKHDDVRRRDWVAQLRSTWADRCNAALERAGVERRYDPRSYAEQGLPRLAGEHLGPAASALERAGIPTAAGTRNGIRDALWQEVGQPAWEALQAARQTAEIAAGAARVVRAGGSLTTAMAPEVSMAIDRRVEAETQVADLLPAAAASEAENPRPARRLAWTAQEAARIAGRRRGPRRLEAEAALARLREVAKEALAVRQDEQRAAQSGAPLQRALETARAEAAASHRHLETTVDALLRAAAVDRLAAAVAVEQRASAGAEAARRRMPREGLAADLATAEADAGRAAAAGDDAGRRIAAERALRLATQLAAADAWENELRRRRVVEAEAEAVQLAALTQMATSRSEGALPRLQQVAATEAGATDLAPGETGAAGLPALAAALSGVAAARRRVDDLLAEPPYGTGGGIAATQEARARAAAEEIRLRAALVASDAAAVRIATEAGLGPHLDPAPRGRGIDRTLEW